MQGGSPLSAVHTPPPALRSRVSSVFSLDSRRFRRPPPAALFVLLLVPFCLSPSSFAPPLRCLSPVSDLGTDAPSAPSATPAAACSGVATAQRTAFETEDASRGPEDSFIFIPDDVDDDFDFSEFLPESDLRTDETRTPDARVLNSLTDASFFAGSSLTPWKQALLLLPAVLLLFLGVAWHFYGASITAFYARHPALA
ncbi:hypothetical protein TGME49_230870 [Toxoplasma gondii ME49]|uniref:Transmembrane protein n=7 Tax=Toxoplasma gondii TaxID=5811 RepID=A0A125YMI6_TOXGV|nr:hypothetical protein TGME49_230870 [Toxoplasma gondii ME49]ESS35613.1 putative transmembrane protein [Toxoplasma gondii VEG]KFG50937.1 putative transmembrane protein [Toxoplasma gondii p89]KFG63628.1 putative transmembrane protein [Toxoplasma gondii RUB]KFH17488.1 putative transmembrane protein [Toxoplasma gondii MAS]KYF46055.1 hypothetical protein TGARI_230870 [Toxoplasma gondii ARI]PIM03315.1 putative transmembrane protein [Toxoplasma gondii COUG]|eukprot:XP_002367988.2 hypothetical protein TGME49_230870 [Toxoplasma gondii ME49]